MRRLPTPLLALALASPALANDSSAAIGLGGLELTRNAAVSMDEEDLFLSQAEVRVRYKFTNRTDRDVDTLVSFPVPNIPQGLGGYLGDRALPDWRLLEFRTTVDGKPVTLDYVERAMIGARDVTPRLAALGWPLRWSVEDVEQEGLQFIQGLTEAQKTGYIREGLLRRSEGDVIPAWNLVTHVTRRQVFPAGKAVEVTHRYVPLVGGSVGGGLDRELRHTDYHRQAAKKYCLDGAFLAAVDKRQAAGRNYVEHWLSYILSSGRNWRGPIGAFRLVVDKGGADNLVSFCMDGVKKISPTQFEVRKTEFEPGRDIDVLIVEWMKGD